MVKNRSSEPSRVFGPVPSRRLGLSLGIDVLPFKTCTYDCVYCQLGATRQKTMDRTLFLPAGGVVTEVLEKVLQGPRPDHLTVSGSGEPTLHSGLGELIQGLKSACDIPVALITNGSLLFLEEVRRNVLLADVLMPTLSAGDEETFQKIHRPAEGLRWAQVLEGMQETRDPYTGLFWLEVFLIKGLNDSEESLMSLRQCIEILHPDRVHVNTAVRPPTDPNAISLTKEELQRACVLLGSKALPIAEFKEKAQVSPMPRAGAEEILAMIERHPCTAQDVEAGLGIPPDRARELLDHLLGQALIEPVTREGRIYYISSRSCSLS